LTALGSARTPKSGELIAGRIRDAIVRGELKPGDSLPSEALLAKMFEVSRPTLREALRILEYEDLIQLPRGVPGARVRAPTDEHVARSMGTTLQSRRTTIRDLYEARNSVETQAVRIAATLRPKASAAALGAHIETQLAVSEAPEDLHQATADFHTLLMTQSENQTLCMVANALQSLLMKHQALVQRTRPPLSEPERRKLADICIRSHRRLVSLIDGGAANDAEQHWREHMKVTSDVWLGGMPVEMTLDVLD
jgi:DNA-binding FadR family transcriptional regulator